MKKKPGGSTWKVNSPGMLSGDDEVSRRHGFLFSVKTLNKRQSYKIQSKAIYFSYETSCLQWSIHTFRKVFKGGVVCYMQNLEKSTFLLHI